MTTKEVLKALRALLSDPKRWTKTVMARDEKNYPVKPTHADAICWCMAGGLGKITGDDLGRTEAYVKARDAINKACGSHLAQFNDYADHGKVLTVIDAAIACEET